MVALIRKELVEKKGWLADSDFVDLLAIAQSGPGPIAINVASLTGHRIRKIPGAAAAVVGASLPSFVVILALVSVLSRFRSSRHLEAVFVGMRPAILGLLANALILVSKSSIKKLRDVAFTVVAAVLLIGFDLNPIYVVIMAMVAGIVIGALTRFRSRQQEDERENEAEDQSENEAEDQSGNEPEGQRNGDPNKTNENKANENKAHETNVHAGGDSPYANGRALDGSTAEKERSEN